MNHLKHVAIIMDGNGRWGLKKKKSRNLGHKKGLKTVEKLIKSYRPTKKHIYRYNYYFTNDNLANLRNKKIINNFLNFFSFIMKLFFKIFKNQSNLMSVVIMKN